MRALILAIRTYPCHGSCIKRPEDFQKFPPLFTSGYHPMRRSGDILVDLRCKLVSKLFKLVQTNEYTHQRGTEAIRSLYRPSTHMCL